VSIPDHLHSQGVTLLRLEPGVTIGLGKGFQLSFHLPVDIKNSRISYLLSDGTPFDPPYGNVHHRNETLFGLGDARLMARWGVTIPATPVILGIGLGAALPTGKTEENPFDAASREEFHQHMQFGSGTVDPLGAFHLIVRGKNVGLLASASTRVPVYANEKGYRGAIQVSAAVGPTLRLPEPLRTIQLSLTGEFEWLSAEQWNGSPGENSGLVTAGMRLGLIWNVRPSLAIQANLLARAYERSTGAQFTRPVTLTLGVSGFLDLRKLGKKKPEADTHQH
jgi:hypothetical protein